MNVRSQVYQIIADQAGVDIKDIAPQKSLAELGIDSLGLVESIFAIEEAFDIEVPFNANDPEAGDFDVSSVGAVVDAVESLISQQSG